MKILFLEDDEETARAVASGLTSRGYDVVAVGSVESATDEIRQHRFDAAILDVMVPGGTGYDILSLLRAEQHGVPVILLTALNAVDDRVRGLESGADDYLVKPFAFTELVARLRAILRRPRESIGPMRVAEIEADPLHRVASFQGKPINLSPKEFDLLRCFMENCGETLTRAQLLDSVWGFRFDPGTNVVDVHVKRLRDKLQVAGVRDAIQTRRGVGYVMLE